MATRSARDLGPGDWILSYFSLQNARFEERLDAAAEAGFAGIGLLIHDYRKLRESGQSDEALRNAVDQRGLVVAEIEALMGWAGGEAERGFARADLETACQMAEVFEARHMQAIGPYAGSLADAADAFGQVCDRAAEVGLRIAIEFLPPNNIPDAGVALEIAERAGRPNGGVCVDSWHHFRGAADDALLRALPGERIISIQLNDGPLKPVGENYFQDCMDNRLPVGKGEFDLAHLLDILDDCDTRAPLSFETIATDLRDRPAGQVARLLADAARSLRR